MGRKFNDSILSKILSVGYALVLGKGVSKQRFEARVRICQRCPYVRGKGIETHCSICGCNVSAEKKLINLARFEETDLYGCHHPEGSQWKAQNV